MVALSVEKYYMALTEIQLKYVGFMAPLAKKVPDPWTKHMNRENKQTMSIVKLHIIIFPHFGFK